MNMTTKHEVLRDNLTKWLACRGDKEKRGKLIKELAQLLSMHEKSVGRAMKRLQLQDKNKEEKRGREVYYGKNVDAALFTIWKEMDYPCAENMHSAISEYTEHFIKDGKWKHGDEATGKLRAMSMGTLKNRIENFREKYNKKHGRSATTPSPLKGMIPIRKSHTWVNLPPGYLQTDSVAHCGDLLTDDVIYSVGCVDFATYWSEYTAQWNKGEKATRESLETIIKRFPFPVIELHPDTGNEFINYHVHRWAQKEKIAMTRSEPYKKNDNMCIEERNNSVARAQLGYARLDDSEWLSTAREILRISCLLGNHFRPVRRMTSKTRIEGGDWKKTYEKEAKTPYQRVIESKNVSQEVKDKLRAEHDSLNPLALKRELDMLKQKLSRMLTEKNN